MSTRWVTAGLTVLALITAAWFGLGVRQATDTAHAGSLITGTTRLTSVRAQHARSLLQSAGALNPDTQVDVLRAELALGQGRRLAARRILERVVAEEPANAVAWEWLARAAVGNLREFFTAAFRIRQLVPPVPPPP